MEDKVPEMKRTLTYDDKVIKKIAGIASDGVQGVLTVSGGLMGSITDRLRADDETKGISAEVGQKQVALDLNVVCEYGRHVPQLFDEVAQKVTKSITEMTGLEVVELNMHVEDVLDKAEFEQMRQKIGGADAKDDKTQDARNRATPAPQPAVQASSVH